MRISSLELDGQRFLRPYVSAEITPAKKDRKTPKNDRTSPITDRKGI
jgi:hypothetical protein